MYRDDREALLHRISILEARVVELEELRRRVAMLEAELAVRRRGRAFSGFASKVPA